MNKTGRVGGLTTPGGIVSLEPAHLAAANDAGELAGMGSAALDEASTTSKAIFMADGDVGSRKTFTIRPGWSYCDMIEDVEFTRNILERFATDEKWPSNATLDTLSSEFSDEAPDRIAYHVYCAHDAGLLEAQVNKTSTLDGVSVTVGYIDGLTQTGGEYVKDSRSSYWDKAKVAVSKSGSEVTTILMKEMLRSLITQALGM